MIEVRFYATLRIGRDKIYHGSSQEFTTVAELLSYFRLAIDDASLVLVNSEDASLNDVIRDGDVVELFPPTSGAGT